MRIFVKAKTRARKEYVEKIDATHFVVAVKAVPVEGKANDAIAAALAEYFDIHRRDVILLSGRNATRKVFQIS